jgi:DNA-binding ferritin-like protein (Dps family)
MRIQEIIVSIQDAIEGKRKWQKKWRAHMARVKALPQDYQIVYKEIQNYLFKVGPVELIDGTDYFSTDLLSGIVDLFEEGAALGKGVLDVTGKDVAAFCDDLIKDSKTFADVLEESIDQEVNQTVKKVMNKTK